MNIKETANPKLYLIYTTDFGQWALKEIAIQNYMYTTDFGQWEFKETANPNYICVTDFNSHMSKKHHIQFLDIPLNCIYDGQRNRKPSL